VRPGKAEATLLKHGVPSKTSREALDEHWQLCFAARPEVRAEFEGAVAQFTGWLQTLPG
jgi:hypothetical protein